MAILAKKIYKDSYGIVSVSEKLKEKLVKLGYKIVAPYIILSQ
jgi:hypothetical protein